MPACFLSGSLVKRSSSPATGGQPCDVAVPGTRVSTASRRASSRISSVSRNVQSPWRPQSSRSTCTRAGASGSAGAGPGGAAWPDASAGAAPWCPYPGRLLRGSAPLSRCPASRGRAVAPCPARMSPMCVSTCRCTRISSALKPSPRQHALAHLPTGSRGRGACCDLSRGLCFSNRRFCDCHRPWCS